ncbi:MAG: hypothetical protein ACE5FY_05970 [Nitrospiria bacterium]
MQTAQTALPSKRTRRRKGKKEGRFFFLTLLTISGLIIIFLTITFFLGKEIYIFTYEKLVINKEFMSLLPQEYTLEKSEEIRDELIQFYEASLHERVNDAALLEISNELREIMNDNEIIPDEVESLLTHIREKMETQ